MRWVHRKSRLEGVAGEAEIDTLLGPEIARREGDCLRVAVALAAVPTCFGIERGGQCEVPIPVLSLAPVDLDPLSHEGFRGWTAPHREHGEGVPHRGVGVVNRDSL
jgi:hypothetical protein